VLHISDWHLDPRYDIGSEANCSQYLCCRPYSTNTKLDTVVSNASLPASRFGSLYCDSPPDLALSSFTSMPSFFNLSSVAFSIFTGDIVSHDNDDQLSRAYVEYEEEVTYQVFKARLGSIPIYATLGNHDSLPEAYNSQNSLNPSANAFSWNYNLLSSMWQNDGWITATEASYASTHYGAYAHTTAQGLRIISINTDFWYVDNVFNYWNFTNPDTSGVLSWLANELTACEAKGQRAWIIGHVLSGYDGSNALPNPSALFYSIVRRFSPTTIAGVFFGHTHEDQLQIFYDYLPNSTITKNGITLRNTTLVDYSKPLTMGFIGPSITPLTGNNAGYQLYQVDAATFEVTGIQTYIANVSESLTWTAPVWKFEYDARTAYNVNGTWPKTSPLNATFWNDVTYSMLSNLSLVEEYNLYETKSSVVTKNCSTAACAKQKVCYIRSGSAALGSACGDKSGPF
jgi:sphingomyelin phosphodiesterase